MKIKHTTFGIQKNTTVMDVILPFTHFFYSSSNPVLITNTAAEIQYVNKAWEKLTGYTFAEVQGKNPRIFSSNKTPKYIYERSWAALRSGKSFTTDQMIERRKNGTEYQILATCYPIRDGANNLFFVQMQHDITMRAKLENKLKLHSFILENMNEGVCLARVKDERIVYTNPKFERMLGYKRDELLNKPLTTFNVKAESIKNVRKKIISSVRKYKKYNYEIMNIKKDGKPIWCRTVISEFSHAEYGRVWVVVKEDISKEIEFRKKLEESERRFRMAAERYPHIFGVFDTSGRILYTNSMATKITGIKRKAFLGKTLGELFPKETAEKVDEPLKKVIQTGTMQSSEETIYFPKYGRYTFNFTFIPILDTRGRLREVIGITIDVTEKAEREELKNRFITMVSHELRSPITAIKIFAQLLTKGTKEKIKREKIDYIAINIDQQTEKLARLVNDLLDVGRIQAGKMMLRKKRFDLNKLVEKNVDDLQLAIKTHILVRKGEVNKIIYGDEARIEQVLINLITNAVKYSQPKSKIVITLKQENENAVVSVKDTGRGIPKSNLKNIFESFYRVEENGNGTRERSLGLGLFIAAEIIKKHKGKIWAESIMDKGSTFYFSLPYNE